MLDKYTETSALQMGLSYIFQHKQRDSRYYDKEEADFLSHYSRLPADPTDFMNVVSTFMFRNHLPADLRDRVRLAPNQNTVHETLEDLMNHCRKVRDVTSSSQQRAPAPSEQPRRQFKDKPSFSKKRKEGDRERPCPPNSAKTCMYCQKRGHVVEECFQLRSRIALPPPPPPPGHPAQDPRTRGRGAGKGRPRQ